MDDSIISFPRNCKEPGASQSDSRFPCGQQRLTCVLCGRTLKLRDLACVHLCIFFLSLMVSQFMFLRSMKVWSQTKWDHFINLDFFSWESHQTMTKPGPHHFTVRQNLPNSIFYPTQNNTVIFPVASAHLQNGQVWLCWNFPAKPLNAYHAGWRRPGEMMDILFPRVSTIQNWIERSFLGRCPKKNPKTDGL